MAENIEDLKTKLLTLDIGETVTCLYAISAVATAPTNLDRKVLPFLAIEKIKKNVYIFKTKYFWHLGKDMLRDCCKSLNIKKFAIYFGFKLRFNYEQLLF